MELSDYKAAPVVKLDSLADVNDIGKPWRYEDGDYTVTRTCPWSPPGCHPVGCGLKLYVNEDGRLEHVEGDENHPVTQGRLCVRCIALKDYEYNNSRILHPMKRDRSQRGNADAWEEITWDEALDLIEERYTEITGKYGKESFVNFGGTGREGGVSCMTYTAMVWQTPNACYTQSGYACYFPRLAAGTMSAGLVYPEMDYAGGLPGRYDDPMYKIPEVMITWGKEPLPSNGDGFFGHSVIDVMKRGSKLISIDPRSNWLSTRAVYHLQLRPGTDTALGMAMLNIIISEDLYDHEFVDKYCYGFEQLAERVKTMTPEMAAEICDLDVEDIYGATRMYANAENAAILWGLATDQKANGTQSGHTIIALEAITGNLDVPGGQLLGDVSDSLGDLGFGWKELGPELQNKIIGLYEYPAYVGMVLNSHADLTLEAMETGEPYEIHGGFIASTNLLAGTCAAQPKRWHDAMVKLDFVFAADCWITPTVQCCADVILPLATYAERQSMVGTHYGASPNMLGAVVDAVKVGETKGDLEIQYELGCRLNPGTYERFKDFEDFRAEFRLGNLGMSYEELREKVVVQRNVSYKKYETGKLRPDGKPGFNTPTGRVELYSTMFRQFGEDPLPYYEEPQLSPVSTPEKMEEYPFVLTTGARTYCYFHSEGKQIPYLREINPDPLIEINPQDALELGIADGQWVRVSNPFGSCVLKAKVTQTVYPGLVMAQHGFWFPEEDGEEPHLYDVWRSNINLLMPHFYVGELGFGAPYKCLICKVEPIEESHDTDMQAIWNRYSQLATPE